MLERMTNQKPLQPRFLSGEEDADQLQTEDLPSRVQKRVHKATHRMSDRLALATTSAQDALRSYRMFHITRGRFSEQPIRSDRWIVRGSNSPESHLMTFSILAALILFEGIANAYFFSKGSDLGLLGGWIQAITVAFTNVIAAFFLIGFLGLRSLQNPDRPFSFAAAAIGVPLAIIFILFLNFTAAHYRDLLEFSAAALALNGFEHQGEILAPVTRALTLTPVETLEALLLFILGVTFAAIAAFKGATFDDRLIGYGPVERRFNRSRAYLETVLKQTPREAHEAAMQGNDRFRTLARALHVREQMDRYKDELEERSIALQYGEAGDLRADEYASEPPPMAR